MLSIALPKGRLGDKVYQLFRDHGYPCAAMEAEDDRRLVLRDEASGVQYLLVKPSDVAIYVEHGAADIGVVGRDTLLETQPDVYELLDLGIGRCRMCVAGPENFYDAPGRTLRVATKFPHITAEHYTAKSRDIDIIKLNGSIELGPIVGLSESIVDIVETGTTLRENDLEEIAYILDATARLIVNRVSFKLKFDRINQLTEELRKILELEQQAKAGA